MLPMWDGRTASEERANQLLIWETLSLAIFLCIAELKANDASANMIVLGAQQITKPTRWIITVRCRVDSSASFILCILYTVY